MYKMHVSSGGRHPISEEDSMQVMILACDAGGSYGVYMHVHSRVKISCFVTNLWLTKLGYFTQN